MSVAKTSGQMSLLRSAMSPPIDAAEIDGIMEVRFSVKVPSWLLM
jgi:hypothetical protein